MSSRFVPAGAGAEAGSAPTPSNDDWDKARQKVEDLRKVKLVESGKQEDGKSLYEVLQANKAAKQEAFEEATKVRNQFRSLDDSEVEFLDSIRESERARDYSVRQETAEQLELFRKQRSVAEQGNTELDDTTITSKQQPSIGVWTTLKKRRRDKDERDPTVTKLRKSSSSIPSEDQVAVKETDNKTSSTKESPVARNNAPSITNSKDQTDAEKPISSGLGLGAYDSDDDD